jgi:hypothetical protein
MRLPVSRIWAQMRHGAGKTSEASASHIPRKWERRELAARATVGQAYAGCGFRGREIWHDSCQFLWHSHSWLCGFRQFDSEFTDRPQNRRAWVPHPLRFLQRAGLDFYRDKKQWNLRQLGRKSSPLHNSRDSRIRPRTVRLHLETSESTLIESANIAQRRVAVPLYSSPCSCFSAHTTQWRAQGTASRRFC